MLLERLPESVRETYQSMLSYDEKVAERYIAFQRGQRYTEAKQLASFKHGEIKGQIIKLLLSIETPLLAAEVAVSVGAVIGDKLYHRVCQQLCLLGKKALIEVSGTRKRKLYSANELTRSLIKEEKPQLPEIGQSIPECDPGAFDLGPDAFATYKSILSYDPQAASNYLRLLPEIGRQPERLNVDTSFLRRAILRALRETEPKKLGDLFVLVCGTDYSSCRYELALRVLTDLTITGKVEVVEELGIRKYSIAPGSFSESLRTRVFEILKGEPGPMSLGEISQAFDSDYRGVTYRRLERFLPLWTKEGAIAVVGTGKSRKYYLEGNKNDQVTD